MIELIYSLIQFYPDIFLFLSYAGECMNRRHLPGNFVDNPEALFRKTRAKLKKRSSTLQQEASSNQEDPRNLSSDFEAMANKSIREFSAPIRTTSALDLLQRSMATLSSSLDLSTWCNPTSSMGRHTKMLVLISNTLWRYAAHSPYQESPKMLYYFAFSHSHY